MKKRVGVNSNRKANSNTINLILVISLAFILLFLILSFNFENNGNTTKISLSPESYTFSLTKNTLHYIGLPLDTKNYSINYLFSDAPLNTTIYIWSSNYSIWQPSQKTKSPGSTNYSFRPSLDITPGNGIAIRPGEDYTNSIYGESYNNITIKIIGSWSPINIPYSNDYYTASRVLEEVSKLDSSCYAIRAPNDLPSGEDYSYVWWSLDKTYVDQGIKTDFKILKDKTYFVLCSNTTNFIWTPKKVNSFYEFNFDNGTYHYAAMPLDTKNYSLDYLFPEAQIGTTVYLWRYNYWAPYTKSINAGSSELKFRPFNVQLLPGEPFIMKSNGDYSVTVFGDSLNTTNINIQGLLTPFSIAYSNDYYTASRVLEEVSKLDSSCYAIRAPNDYNPLISPSLYSKTNYSSVSCNSGDNETSRYQSSYDYNRKEPIYTITCQNMSSNKFTYSWWSLNSEYNDNSTKSNFKIDNNKAYFVLCSNTTNFTWTPNKIISSMFCGDGSCNNGETCSSCSEDCGSCSSSSSNSNNNHDKTEDNNYKMNDSLPLNEQKDNSNNQVSNENIPIQNLNSTSSKATNFLIFWVAIFLVILILAAIYILTFFSNKKRKNDKNEEVAPPFLIKEELPMSDPHDKKIKEQIEKLLIEGHNYVNQKIIVRADDVYNKIKGLYDKLNIKDKEIYNKIIEFYRRFN